MFVHTCLWCICSVLINLLFYLSAGVLGFEVGCVCTELRMFVSKPGVCRVGVTIVYD